MDVHPFIEHFCAIKYPSLIERSSFCTEKDFETWYNFIRFLIYKKKILLKVPRINLIFL
jgi:hypothetical protein